MVNVGNNRDIADKLRVFHKIYLDSYEAPLFYYSKFCAFCHVCIEISAELRYTRKAQYAAVAELVDALA